MTTEETPAPETMPASIAAGIHADRRQDLGEMKGQLSPDVTLVSPLTDGFTFTGPDEVMAVFESAFVLLRDIVMARTTGAGREWVIYGENTLRGRNLEEIEWLRTGEDGLINHITLFIRPASAAVSLLASIGPHLHCRGAMSKLGSVASAGAASLAAILRLVESRLIPRLK